MNNLPPDYQEPPAPRWICENGHETDVHTVLCNGSFCLAQLEEIPTYQSAGERVLEMVRREREMSERAKDAILKVATYLVECPYCGQDVGQPDDGALWWKPEELPTENVPIVNCDNCGKPFMLWKPDDTKLAQRDKVIEGLVGALNYARSPLEVISRIGRCAEGGEQNGNRIHVMEAVAVIDRAIDAAKELTK